jgi:FkbM family methyltransferase
MKDVMKDHVKDRRKDRSQPAMWRGLDEVQAALADYLYNQVRTLASAADQGQQIDNVRRMCAIISAGRSAFTGTSELLSHLRATPVVMPVPGGCAEFAFHFWRDVNTIAYAGWERQILRVLQTCVEPGHTVIDVGAHVGHFTIYAAHLVGSSGRVVAVEPAPINFDTLRKNVQRNGIEAFTTALQVALAATEGTADLFDDGGTAGTEYSLVPNRSRGVACQTTLITLDRLVAHQRLERVDFVKIDAEGAELDILRGGKQTLRRPGISVLVELHPWAVSPHDVCALLEAEGLRLYEVRDRLMPLSPRDLRNGGRPPGHVLATRATIAEPEPEPAAL